MTHKQFINWCNERACDGLWDFITAITCLNIIEQMKRTPFYKKKKKWKEFEATAIELVNAINARLTDKECCS